MTIQYPVNEMNGPMCLYRGQGRLCFQLLFGLLLLLAGAPGDAADVTNTTGGGALVQPLLVAGTQSDAALHVETAPQYPKRVRRTVLALYDGAVDEQAEDSLAHEYAALPLNHLGLRLQYLDVRGLLPDFSADDDIRGVLVWLGSSNPDRSPGLLRWLNKALDAGRRLAVIGEIAGGGANAEEIGLLARLGVRLTDGYVATPLDARVQSSTPALVDFEHKLLPPLPPYPIVRAIPQLGTVHLRIGRPGRERSLSEPLVSSRAGVYVANGYSHFTAFIAARSREWRRWYVNPFELFGRAFDTGNLPAPDTTTLAGRRLYYSHVDGDGWRNLSRDERNSGSAPVLASQVVLEEIISPYPDLPVTVAPVTADLDPSWFGTEETIRVARELFALPQVEPGSHTHSHPFAWHFFEQYRPEKEAPFIKAYERLNGSRGKPAKDSGYAEAGLSTGLSRSEAAAGTLDGYTVPRTYGNVAFNLNQEIQGSVAIINALSPPGKSVRLLQWSGDCRPFEAALAHAEDAGLLNINGGDSRFDPEYDSVAWVAPLGMRVGRHIQIYASNSNENIYTELWNSRFFGQRYLKSTLERTETPRRLKPINLYYHMYSGEREASVKALRGLLNAVREQALTPVDASHFAAIAKGFFQADLYALGPARWQLRNRGRLQTVRFDDAAQRQVDFPRSEGVIGQRHRGSSLYVALDENVSAPVIALKDVGQPASESKHKSFEIQRSTTQPMAGEAPARVNPAEASPGRDSQGNHLGTAWLIESRWHLWALQRDVSQSGFTILGRGFGAGEMLWQVEPNSHWRVSMSHVQMPSLAAPGDDIGPRSDAGVDPSEPIAESVGDRQLQMEVRADANGRLRVVLPARPGAVLRLRLDRLGAAS